MNRFTAFHHGICLAGVLVLVIAACANQPTVGTAVQAPQQSASTFQTYDARTFYENTSFRGGSFSHDESKILLTSDATGIFNVYAQPVAGGEPTPLTSSTSESIFGLSYFPADDRFLYSSDRGGNELNHIYVVENGAPRDLTPGDKVKARFYGWSGDRSHFYIATNERDPQAFDLKHIHLKPPAVRRYFLVR